MEDLYQILPYSAKQALRGISTEELVNSYNQNLLFSPGKLYIFLWFDIIYIFQNIIITFQMILVYATL